MLPSHNWPLKSFLSIIVMLSTMSVQVFSCRDKQLIKVEIAVGVEKQQEIPHLCETSDVQVKSLHSFEMNCYLR